MTMLKVPGLTTERRPLRVLLVEDCEPDALLISRVLFRGGFAPECRRVDSREEMVEALGDGDWDLILADHSMPQFSAPEALEMVKQRGVDIPFIIVSGHIEEETAVAAMRAGAHDYVMKDRLARLLPAVERELREAGVRRARRQNEMELQRARDELETRVEQRTSALKAAYLKLESVVAERRRLENELLEIAENERRRIGFDLHDDLGQKLTGASMMMKGLQTQLETEGHACAREVANIQGLINEIIQHTHNLAKQHSELDAGGDTLPAMLKGLASNVRSMFDTACTFTMRGEIPELPANTTTQLYKIAQEAVSNAIKHGHCKHVTVSLVNTGSKLILNVRNDGVSFSPSSGPSGRMGLRIMNYRANTIGASFEIVPEEEGTVVTCALPVGAGTRNARKSGDSDGPHSLPADHETGRESALTPTKKGWRAPRES